MKRHVVLTALLAAGLMSIAVGAAQQAGRAAQGARGAAPLGGTPSVDNLQVQKLTDNLYVLGGGGGNTAAFITANGVVLVDTKVSGWGPSIIAKLKTLTPKPVTTIINTHTHFDHVNGNAEFPTTVDIVTSENTKKLMEDWHAVYGVQFDTSTPFKTNGGRGLPKRTFKERMTLGSGADEVDLLFHGPAHTGGDTWVVFKAARVMHAGDAFAGKSAPIMDMNNGGSAIHFAETIAKAAQTPNIDRVITGHSTVMTMADLKEFGEFNRDFVNAALAAKKAGKTVDQFVAEWKVPAKYTGYTTPAPDARGQWKSNAEVAWAGK
jgi:glyoxylase-like metal-dependent hydrolase (beta-lactamase superfamily II)